MQSINELKQELYKVIVETCATLPEFTLFVYACNSTQAHALCDIFESVINESFFLSQSVRQQRYTPYHGYIGFHNKSWIKIVPATLDTVKGQTYHAVVIVDKIRDEASSCYDAICWNLRDYDKNTPYNMRRFYICHQIIDC